MPSLTQRSYQHELMDDTTLDFLEFKQTLGEIEKINRVTNAYRPTLKALDYFSRKVPHTKIPLRILDIGFGNGDFLRRIHAWAQKNKIWVELTGVDLNQWSAQAAQELTPAALQINYLTCNIFDFVPQKPFHIIINSLFTHHLNDEEIIRVLDWMTANSSLGWFINDLHRHTIPYFFIHYYVKFLGFNRLVKNDAPLSVARAFKRKDWEKYIQQTQCSFDKIKISWHWPFRYGVLYDT